MKKWQIANLVAFLVMIMFAGSLIYALGTMNLTSPYSKPWHLLPMVHEDSLSATYKANYDIIGASPLRLTLYDSSRTNIFILVDAWGVPVQESDLEEDMKVFEQIPHRFALHRRLANYTRHAEHAELRNNSSNSFYLFGGDSLQFNRYEYVPTLGFQQVFYCGECDNNYLVEKIDSLLNNVEPKPDFIAWTVLASSIGNKKDIRQVLQKISTLASKHANVRFVVQGTHRPMLCGSETKKMYKSHWVPTVILNN